MHDVPHDSGGAFAATPRLLPRFDPLNRRDYEGDLDGGYGGALEQR
jgi:hypothetical protein